MNDVGLHGAGLAEPLQPVTRLDQVVELERDADEYRLVALLKVDALPEHHRFTDERHGGTGLPFL